MDYTRLTNLQVTGGLVVGSGDSAIYVNVGSDDAAGTLFAPEIEGGTLSGVLHGTGSAQQTSKNDSLTISGMTSMYYGFTATAASKTLTVNAETGTMFFIANEGGTNAFTFKNVSGDTGTSIAAGKVALVVASKTANATKVFVLN